MTSFRYDAADVFVRALEMHVDSVQIVIKVGSIAENVKKDDVQEDFFRA